MSGYLSRHARALAPAMVFALGGFPSFASGLFEVRESFGGRSRRYRPRSRYMPHQGERECARRRAQAAKGGRL